MVNRYPGLTLVGGLAMAFAIWAGAATFEFLRQIVEPRLPLAGGERLVAICNWEIRSNQVETQILHDFVDWRRQLRSVEAVGAWRAVDRNLIAGDGRGEPVELAEISASAFRLTRARPYLGRTLLADDELPGAPAVLVIGYDVWQARFGGDSTVIGRAVKLGTEPVTIVGVMPEFA